MREEAAKWGQVQTEVPCIVFVMHSDAEPFRPLPKASREKLKGSDRNRSAF